MQDPIEAQIGSATSRAGELVPASLLVLLYLHLVSWSWNKWLDPVIDTGRDLYLASEIAAGRLQLYRDAVYNYPPLAPWLLAGAAAICGDSLAVFRAIGIATSIAVASTLWIAGRTATGSIPGAVTPVLLFLAWNFSSTTSPGANFVFPYSHAAAIGMLFLLIHLAALLRWSFAGRGRAALAVALLFGGLAAWTKLEYALCTGCTLATAAVLQRMNWKPLAAFAAAMAGSFGAMAWAFSDLPPERHWLWGNVLRESLIGGESARVFFSRVFGSTGPANLSAIAGGAALLALLVYGVHLHERLTASERWSPERRALLRTLLIGTFVVLSFLLGRRFLLLRGWSLLQPLLLVWALFRDRRSPLPILLVFSMTASSRVALNLVPEWYGFVYTVPLYLVIAYVLFGWLPERGVISTRSARLLILPIALVAVSGLAFHFSVYGVPRHEVVTPRGSYLDHDPARARIIGEVIQAMEHRTDAGLVVFPEGVMLNYLTGMSNPTSFYLFTPVEIGSRSAENQFLREFGAEPPRFSVLLTRDVSEYGSQGFGIDYAIAIRRHLREHYSVYRRWRSPTFNLTILERKDSRSADAHP